MTFEQIRKVLSVFTLVTIAMGAAGCEHVETSCAVAPTCEANETESQDQCEPGEEGCREERSCDAVVFCREQLDCPAIAYQCPAGTTMCDAPDEDGACEEFTMGGEGCEQTLYCRPEEQCLAELSCEPDEQLSGDACTDDEDDCRRIELCGSIGYCRPVAQCLAVPVCEPDEMMSDAVCADNEDGCRAVTECGQTIYCRPDVNCDAVPVCDEGESSSEVVCADDEEGCRALTVCGETIYCRADVNCDAVPVCDEGESSSEVICEGDEEGCRALTVCGETIYCRSETRVALNECREDTDYIRDGFQYDAVRIDGDTLLLSVSYSGGCETHIFGGCFGSFLESSPVQVPVTISHDANGDICEAIVSEVIELDLMPLQEAYRAAYGVEEGQMFLNLDGYDGRIVYEFGR
ncbi:MAG: hypothetical protein ACON3Z_18465 [Bradymonadia bacterium]